MNPVTNKPTDAELFAQFSNGDEAAFQEIVSRYKNSLYIFLKRFLNKTDLIDDVFQETFMQLFTSRESYDISRPLQPWLFTIAANKAKDTLRKEQRKSTIPIGTIVDSEQMSFNDVLNTLTSVGVNVDCAFEMLHAISSANNNFSFFIIRGFG